MKTKYMLEMSDEQAVVVMKALEFYTRMKLGQFRELCDMCLDFTDSNYSEKYAQAEKYLLDARNVLIPDLSHDMWHSHGVFQSKDTICSWQLFLAVRSTRAWHLHPEGGITTNFDRPFGDNVPVCKVVPAEQEGQGESSCQT